jgi:hypothetical protein
VLDADPQRIRVRVNRLVLLENGWEVWPARALTLSVTPEAVVRRRVSPGTFEAMALADFRRNDRVVVVTNEFSNSVASARARPHVHTIRDILLRLET